MSSTPKKALLLATLPWTARLAADTRLILHNLSPATLIVTRADDMGGTPMDFDELYPPPDPLPLPFGGRVGAEDPCPPPQVRPRYEYWLPPGRERRVAFPSPGADVEAELWIHRLDWQGLGVLHGVFIYPLGVDPLRPPVPDPTPLGLRGGR